MKHGFSFVLLLLLFLGNGKIDLNPTFSQSYYNDSLDKAPEFFVLEWKEGTILSPKKTDLFIESDSMGKQEVFVLIDNRQEPILYTSDIVTPVCADGECKLMNIRLYWTLLGEYAGFNRYLEFPLTKYDHDEFKKEDYQKLHTLLADDKSILKRRTIDELVEKPTLRTVNGVDALSGATIAEVKESVVSGALYSCYVAWHLVHGAIRNKIKDRILSDLSTNMLRDMLYSNNIDYQLFALNKMDTPQFIEHHLRIADIFKTGVPLVRSIIAKALPSRFESSLALQKPFWEAFDEIDLGSRSLLLKNLHSAPSFVPDMVSMRLGALTKNQLKLFLDSLSGKEHSEKLMKNLTVFANSKNETYSYLVESYLADF